MTDDTMLCRFIQHVVCNKRFFNIPILIQQVNIASSSFFPFLLRKFLNEKSGVLSTKLFWTENRNNKSARRAQCPHKGFPARAMHAFCRTQQKTNAWLVVTSMRQNVEERATHERDQTMHGTTRATQARHVVSLIFEMCTDKSTMLVFFGSEANEESVGGTT